MYSYLQYFVPYTIFKFNIYIIIPIDEIDSLLIRDEKNFMRRFVNQLLQQLDGVSSLIPAFLYY